MRVFENLNIIGDENIFIKRISGKVSGGKYIEDPKEVSTEKFPYAFRIYKDGVCLVMGHTTGITHAIKKLQEFRGASIRFYDRKTRKRIR